MSVFAYLGPPATGACTESVVADTDLTDAAVGLAKCTLGTLAPGATRTITVAFSALPADAAGLLARGSGGAVRLVRPTAPG